MCPLDRGTTQVGVAPSRLDVEKFRYTQIPCGTGRMSERHFLTAYGKGSDPFVGIVPSPKPDSGAEGAAAVLLAGMILSLSLGPDDKTCETITASGEYLISSDSWSR